MAQVQVDPPPPSLPPPPMMRGPKSPSDHAIERRLERLERMVESLMAREKGAKPRKEAADDFGFNYKGPWFEHDFDKEKFAKLAEEHGKLAEKMFKLGDAELSPRSRLIMTYALCGFANFGSLGIMIGGLASMVPERRAEIVALAPKTIVSGTLATALTGAVVGVLW
jgi:hypothetical protein